MNFVVSLHNPKQRFAALSVLSVLLIVALLVLCNISYAYAYRGQFFPGTRVGAVNIGGLTFAEGRALVLARADALIERGASVAVNGSSGRIPLRVIATEDADLSQDLVTLEVNEALVQAEGLGASGAEWRQSWERIRTAVGGWVIEVPVKVNVEAIQAELLKTFAEYYNPAVEPAFMFVQNEATQAWEVTVTPGTAGRAFDVEAAVGQFTETMRNLNLAPVVITVVDQQPAVSDAQAQGLTGVALAALAHAPYTLRYEVNRFEEYGYPVDAAFLTASLAPERGEEGTRLGLEGNAADELFATIEGDINIEAKNAKFEVVENRVQEFQPSTEGRAVDAVSTRAALLGALGTAQEKPIEIAVNITEAQITTESANTFGIKEILGVGTSGWKGSPGNRIKNIRHATQKLNGVLIPPGAEFSALEALEPVTLEGGYLPEMVIKGDEIKPEVGGGLCQIGTTLFRMAMNSGMDITERRNHSLVVSYYNDPTNGNPGTDATLYGPHPDLRFINDTGHYMLITTEMNADSTSLRYTLWGTSDKRKGYYTPPVVHKWMPAGPVQTKYTPTLAPGVKKCQSAHPGADTSFVYYIERPDGTVEEETFASHYRPLPTICRVGALPEQIGEDGQLIETPPAEPEPSVDAPVKPSPEPTAPEPTE